MEFADVKYKFDDTFTVKKRDNEKFEKVPRYTCEGATFGALLECDVHDDLFPMKEGDSFFMALMDTVSSVTRGNEGTWDQSNEPSIIDHFDYVMYGKLYKKEEKKDKISIFISFGGLLFKITAGRRELDSLNMENRLYVLMKRA